MEYPEEYEDDELFEYIMTLRNKTLDDYHIPPEAGQAAICLSLIFSVAGINNIRSPMSSHLRLIASLCSADLLIGATHLGIHIVLEIDDTSTCQAQILFPVNVAMFLCSIFNIVAMAIDHYIAIVKPGKYDYCCSKGRSSLAVILIWVSAISMLLFVVMIAYIEHAIQADQGWTTCDTLRKATTRSVNLVFIVAPVALGLLLYTYVQISRHIRASTTDSSQVGITMNVKARAAMTTVVIVVAFAVTWLPLVVCWIWTLVGSYGRLTSIVFEYISLLPVVNATCNPVLYALRVKKIKDGVRTACCCCCKQKRKEEYEIGTMMTKYEHTAGDTDSN